MKLEAKDMYLKDFRWAGYLGVVGLSKFSPQSHIYLVK
jgi:hypothetical protein